MSSKSIFGFIILLAFLSMPLALVLKPVMESREADPIGLGAEFIGQDTAEVGELVRFLAEGEIVKWQCLPETSDSESYGEFNENFVISFREPGYYTVVAAIYAAGELEIFSQEVTVEGAVSPTEVDPVFPTGIDASLVNRVTGWAKQYNVNKSTCISLSENFEEVLLGIELGEFVTPGQIILATADLNSELKLNKKLISALQGYLTSQADSGALRTMDQHTIVWRSIAGGLRNAAN